MVILRGLWWLFVTALVLVGGIVGSLLAKDLQPMAFPEPNFKPAYVSLFGFGVAAAGAMLGFLFAVFFFRKLVTWVSAFERVPLLDKIVALVGILAGLILAILVTLPFTRIPGWGLPITIFASVAGVVLGVAFSVSAKEQIAYVFPTISKEPPLGMHYTGSGYAPKVLDTNIIIDGRITNIVGTGFVDGPFFVPDFVLGELHHIADSEDNLKRARGRRGLDILNRLKSMEGVDVHILDDYTEEEVPYDEVDTRLVRLAEARDAKVLTNDFGVAEIAKLHNVPVLNVNELATALKPVYLPGENFNIALIREGKEPDQAVGYLEDGTMVVVKRAAQMVGKTMAVEVETVLQTSAGKMIFAVLPDDNEREES
jgi:uncharacterized protein YacL